MPSLIGDPIGRGTNPLYDLSQESDDRETQRVMVALDGSYKPFSWLTVDGNFSFDRADIEESHVSPAGLARTRALETLVWMNNTVHPTFTHVFMPEKFTDDAAAQQAIRAFAIARYRELLGEIEALAAKASPWMVGERPGALDAYALTLLRWGGYAGIDPTTLPATWDLAQRFAELPPVARAIERERLQLNVFKG